VISPTAPLAVIALPEEVSSHPDSDDDNEASYPRGRKLLRVVGSKISSGERACRHYEAFFPDNCAGDDEGDDRDAVDDSAEHNLQGVHGVDVGHAHCGQHGEIQDPDSAAEIASVDGDDQLENRCDNQRSRGSVAGDRASRAAREAAAEHEEQRGSKHEPGHDSEESLRGRMQQEISSGDSSDDARDRERNHDTARNIKMLAIGSSRGRRSDPKGNRVGSVGGDGSDSGEHQSGEGNEASSASDGIHRAAESSGEKKEDGSFEMQILDVSRRGASGEGAGLGCFFCLTFGKQLFVPLPSPVFG
jgi:hypothetical protein